MHQLRVFTFKRGASRLTIRYTASVAETLSQIGEPVGGLGALFAIA
jgi:hypothetical protein